MERGDDREFEFHKVEKLLWKIPNSFEHAVHIERNREKSVADSSFEVELFCGMGTHKRGRSGAVKNTLRTVSAWQWRVTTLEEHHHP